MSLNNPSRDGWMHTLLPVARRLVEDAIDGRAETPAIRAQVMSLLAGVPSDHRITTVLGAIASAVFELDREVSRGIISLDSTVDQLAANLIRIAYNRWQREQRKTARIQKHATLGETQSIEWDGTGRVLDSFSDNDFVRNQDARFSELVDNLLEKLTAGDVRILTLYAEGHSMSEIAERIGRHRTTVGRKLDRFGDIIRRFRDRNE